MTIILAKIFGFYFLAFGLLFLLYPSRSKAIYKSMQTNESVLILGAIIALFVGAFIVSVHNIWVKSWPTFLTLIGWLSLIKGFIILLNPHFKDLIFIFTERSDLFYRIVGLIMLLFSLFLFYESYLSFVK